MKETAKGLAIEIYKELNRPINEKTGDKQRTVEEIILPYFSETERKDLDRMHRIKATEIKLCSVFGNDWRLSIQEVLAGV